MLIPKDMAITSQQRTTAWAIEYQVRLNGSSAAPVVLEAQGLLLCFWR